VAATLIDGLILNIFSWSMLLIVFLSLGLNYFQHVVENLNKPDPVYPTALIVAIVLWWLVMIVVNWLYHALQESGPRHATVGKKLMGIVVTDMQGQPITFARATGRHFARIVAAMIPLAFGFILAAFTEKRQALHDMIASTLVMKKT
jgi:uncharacterized RDD family membrane protein YckC